MVLIFCGAIQKMVLGLNCHFFGKTDKLPADLVKTLIDELIEGKLVIRS